MTSLASRGSNSSAHTNSSDLLESDANVTQPTKSRIETEEIFENNETQILYENHVNHPEIAEIARKSKDIFDVRRVNAGKEYTVICIDDSTEKASYFIYQENPTDYVVMDLTDGIDVYRGKKEVTTIFKVSYVEIS